MKALITGINGFVGKYLETELKNNDYEVYGIDITGKRENVFTLDLAHKESVTDIIKNVNPDYIFHLAGQASVKESWNIPLETLHCNVDNAVNLLDAMYSECRESRLVVVGSADEYGIVSPDQCPLKETRALCPSTPYAISKQTQESIVGCLAKVRNMDVVFARPFNHTGPGQKRGFVIPDFAARIIEIKKNGGDMKIGNLKAKRDFSDVRDVVRAYRLLAEKGKLASNGFYIRCWKLRRYRPKLHVTLII